MQRERFSCEVVEHLATISTSDNGKFDIELNRVSYGGAAPRLDLRRWDKEGGRPLKGISFTDAGAEIIVNALQEYLNRKDK